MQSCVNLLGANCWLESRMREIRTYGSEGGVAQDNALSLPLSAKVPNIWIELSYGLW